MLDSRSVSDQSFVQKNPPPSYECLDSEIKNAEVKSINSSLGDTNDRAERDPWELYSDIMGKINSEFIDGMGQGHLTTMLISSRHRAKDLAKKERLRTQIFSTFQE
jgi:hypothetical protein